MNIDLSLIVPGFDADGVACFHVCDVLTVYSWEQAVELVADDRETPVAAHCPPAWLSMQITYRDMNEDAARQQAIAGITAAREAAARLSAAAYAARMERAA